MLHLPLGLRIRITVIKFEVGEFVTCHYEGKWWLGMVLNVDKEQFDASKQFLMRVCTSLSIPGNHTFWVIIVLYLKDPDCFQYASRPGCGGGRDQFCAEFIRL